VLGVTAVEGRVFTAADASSNEPVVVLSYALWQHAFGGDRSIVGRPLTLVAGYPRRPQVFSVLGVLPRTFRFTYPGETEAWVIAPWSEMTGPTAGFWTVARLAPGVTLAAAQTRVAAIPSWIDPRSNTPERRQIFTLQPITEWVVGETRPSMLLLAGVAFLLLLITCATVASALFVCNTERQRELAVRASVGADRERLVRQLLTEGLLLSVAGSALGALVASLLAPALQTLVPATVPRADEIAVDLWIVAFFAAACGVTTVLATLAPAWRGARVDLVAALKASSSGASPDRSTARWRQTLVGIQAAIATALLLTALLLIVSLWRLSHMPLGFDGERVLTVEMRLIDPRYMAPRPAPNAPPNAAPPRSPALMAFQDELLVGVRTLPGVLEAGLTSAVPFRGVDFVYALNRVGETKPVLGNARFVDAGYFSVLRVPLRRGLLPLVEN
jgi:putative ABC transport system permease protein